MKKAYIKPTMRVVELRQRQSLLVVSDGASLQMYRGSGNQVTDEEDVW